MNDAEIIIKFKADTIDAEQKTKSLKDKLDDTANGMSSAARTLAPASAIAAGAIAGITTVSIDFEKSMANVQAISGSTAEDMERLSEKAREMGKSTVFSASESADALGYMALAGWKTEDMLEGLPGILNLAAAGNTDLATTSDIVTDALTAFGLTAEDSTRLADVMAATMSNSNTTTEMLGESFKYVASLAGTLGQSVEDTSFALGLMANSGIKSSQAGTSLRQVLSRLATDTGGARSSLEELGVQVFNSDGTMRSLRDIIADTQVAFKGLTDEEQAAMGKIIAGQTGMSGFLAMVNATEEDVNKLSEAIDSSSGAAQNMADVMNKSTSNQIKIMMSEVAELGLQLGEALLPAINSLINGLTGVVQWFQNLNPITQKAILGTLLVIAALAPMLAAISNVIKVINLMSTAMTILAGNPIVLIIAAIAAIIAIFISLWNNCEAFRNFFVGLWESLKEAVLVAAEYIGNVLKTISQFFSNLWKTIIGIFNPGALFGAGKQMIEGLWNGIKSAKDWVIDKVKSVSKSVLGAVKGVFGIHSPSKEFAIIGEYNMLGLEKGMENMQPDIQKQIDGMFNLSPSMTGSMNNLLSPNIKVINDIKMETDPLGQVVSNIKTFSGGSKNDYNYGYGGV